ncbi:NADase-type glycan-binding domain-containing protein [Leptospira sp. GIMC2001]|uniref:NADase-type glycan-binding domain-containing protein n=1 Tax=Leptospira sp. GIMC2001 TaxID=1513297 RepID=UPI00234AC0EF|nr:hypothetical protein [Leptospira sp. GIMC2001]WCL50972.1 hypothetical protein O4O04_09215 [Leptospira sp. GIMC2001]
MFRNIFALLVFASSLTAQSISDLTVGDTVRELDDNRNRFLLDHLTDKSSSPWCINGKDWDTRSNIEINLESKSTIKSIFIANGFYDSKLFAMNARPYKIILKSKTGETRQISLKDVHTVQKYEFPDLSTDTLEISFPEIKKGSKFQDLCLSEISFEPITDSGLIAKQKSDLNEANQIIKKEMLFKNPNEGDEDFFKIIPNGNKLSISTNPKKNKFIILYNMFEPVTLILDPLPKINLISAKTDYDKVAIEIDGICEQMNKKDNCKIYFNPIDSSFKVYKKKELVYNSNRQEDFQ